MICVNDPSEWMSMSDAFDTLSNVSTGMLDTSGIESQVDSVMPGLATDKREQVRAAERQTNILRNIGYLGVMCDE